MFWSTIVRKQRTALRVLHERGAAAVGGLARDHLIQLWHRAPGGLARVGGCRFRVNDLDDHIRVLLLMDEYEKEEREAVKRFLDPGLPVIELGGSLGVVSCVINKKLRHAKNQYFLVSEWDTHTYIR